MSEQLSRRKPHNHLAGYKASLRNPLSGGHTVIYNTEEAQMDASQGSHYVSCEDHGQIEYAPSLAKARPFMKDPTLFCTACREIEEQWDNFEPPTVNGEVV